VRPRAFCIVRDVAFEVGVCEDLPLMTDSDDRLVLALVHDANVKLLGLGEDSLGLDHDLADVRRSTNLAEKILSGKATDDDRALVSDVVHPQVRSLYLS
jgi:hypothetical protein